MNIFVDILKDRTAWLGGVTSCIANFVSNPRPWFKPPDSMEGLAALMLSLVTITYIVIKILIAVSKHRRDMIRDL